MSEAVTCNNSNSINSNDNFGLTAHSPSSNPGLGASGLAYLMLSITPEGMFCCTEKLESQRVVGSPWLSTPKPELYLGTTLVGCEGGGSGTTCSRHGWGVRKHGWVVGGLDLSASYGVEGKGDLGKG